MRSLVPVIVVVGVLVSLESRAVAAQSSPGSAASRGPGWLPRTSRLTSAANKVTNAELTEVLDRLTGIERLFVQIEALARPNGFEIEPGFYGFTPNESVLSYSYDATFFVPSKKLAGEGTSCIRVSINTPPGRGINKMEGYSDDRGSFVFEDQRGDPVPGARHVWNHLSPTERSWVDVMFVAGNASPLEPVTRERFQRAKVAFFEAFRSSASAATPYDRWMADAPTRKADRERLRASLPPAQAAAVLKAAEDAERETTESLRKSDAADRAENERLLRGYTGMVEQARAGLASMRPTDRELPAWIEQRAEELSSSTNTFRADIAPLVTPDTPLAAQVFVARPELYQGQRSRVIPRVIQVHLSASLSCQAPAIQRAMVETFQKLDWPALARLVGAKGAPPS